MIDASDEQVDEGGDINSEDQTASTCSTFKKAIERGLSDGEMVAHVTVFLRAGYETTAYTLTYTSYLLALNPDIQQKAQSEIDNYFKDNPVRTHMEVHHECLFIFNLVNFRVHPCMMPHKASPTWITSFKNLFVSIPQHHGRYKHKTRPII